ncbi:MAG TPA: hypothetical protein VGC16_09005 [Rhizomicrobium sp.]
MRNILKTAIIAFGTLGALAIPASAQPYDDGSYGPQGYDQQYGPDPYDQAYAGDSGYPDGYCDPYYGCPDDYDDLPVYDGSVYWDGGWYNGPFFYRDTGGHRQFWVHGGWHYGNARGGHYGPALGRGFANRGFDRGQHNFSQRGTGGGSYGQRGFQTSQRQFANRGTGIQSNFASRGYGGGNGGWRGGSHFQQQAAPQARNEGGGHNWGGGHGGGGHHGR